MADDDTTAQRYESRPFDPEENRRLRQMMDDWDKYQWLWRLFGKITAWTTAIVTAVWLSRDEIARLVKAWLKLP